MKLPRQLRVHLKAFVWDSAKEAQLARRFALANRLWKIPLCISWVDERSLFCLESAGDKLFVARGSRVKLFRNGIGPREEQLVSEYLLNQVTFCPGDLVIDVGANIGEVSRLLARRHEIIPVAIEPDPQEFEALKANLESAGGHALNELLWSEVTDLDFYDGNDSGDSSVFPTQAGLRATKRTTTTLDAVMRAAGLENSPVRLLKLEAEGAEPEILDGATSTLRRTEYVVADVGPERGLAQKTTLVPVLERLQVSGFIPVDVHSRRLTMLFRKSAI